MSRHLDLIWDTAVPATLYVVAVAAFMFMLWTVVHGDGMDESSISRPEFTQPCDAQAHLARSSGGQDG